MIAAWTASDESCDVACAEAVVDIDDGDVGRAGIQHTQQGSDAFEGGAVADAGGDSDDGNRDQAADDAGQSAFHAGANDNHIGSAQSIKM